MADGQGWAFRARLSGACVVLMVSGVFAVDATHSAAGAAGVCGPPVTSVIACENTQPGDPPSDWRVTGSGDATLQGFATQMSVKGGDTVSFKVNATSSAYHVDILRFGYYQGNGARKVQTLTGPFPTRTQPACTTNSSTGLIDCGNWSVALTWTVPTTAVSGIYAAHLVRNDNGNGSLIPFVVRDESSHSDIVVQASDTTWQAYNTYGGNSLYSCTVACPPGNPEAYKGAFKVSYNRPFHTADDDQDRSWLTYAELPMIRFLEQNGYDVSYVSGIDVDTRGSLLLNHKLFISSGHDEYWSGNQRASVENARDHGVNLAFFSGNEVFWKTRWEADSSGSSGRILVCYKDTHLDAPTDPVAWTGTWADPRFSPPGDGGRPQNALTGQEFLVNAGTVDIKVPAAYAKLRLWRNTTIASLTSGQTATLDAGVGTLGYEWDTDPDNGFRPAGLIDMSSTTSTTAQSFTDYGSQVADNQTSTHHLTLYRAPSGALVFGAGTVQWAWGLDNFWTGGAIDRNMQQATVNLFADMGAQPATIMSGLTAVTGSTDTTAPTSTITSPAPNATFSDGARVTISGTATDSGGGVVAGVEVSTDGGGSWHPATIPSAATSTTWSYSWIAHGVPTTAIESRATDDSGNIERPTATTSVGVSCPCSAWGPNVTPAVPDQGDANSVEVGTQFRSDIGGTVTAIRFYKATANTGTHVANLWTAGGTRLAQATYTNETASGWQQVNLSPAVQLQPNTDYVVSTFMPRGHYAADSTYFYNGPAAIISEPVITDAPPLHLEHSTATTENGLYTYSSSTTFPSSTFNGENYFVDVVFVPNGPPTAPGSPTAVTATAGNTSAAVSWSAPANGGSPITSYTVTPFIGSAAQSPVTVTGNPPATSTTVTGLTNGSPYTFTVSATNAIGTSAASAASNAVTPSPPSAPGAPTNVAAVPGNASASVSWSAPPSNGSAITSYTVTPFAGSVAQTPVPVSGNPPATTANVSGLTNGVAYTFVVSATNGIGTGSPSVASPSIIPAVPSAPVVDVKTSVNSNGSSATTAAFNTSKPNELLLAFVSSDGPSVAPQTMAVTGAGLTWNLVGRANGQPGTSEVWRATAPAALSGASVTATEGQAGYHMSLTVVSFQSSIGTGAVQAGGAASGAATVTLATTRDNSLVYAAGNDWDQSVARTLGANQSLVNQWLDTGTGDTYWVQSTSGSTGPAGTNVQINDTAPTTDHWNLLAVEVLGASIASTTAPSAPTGVTAVAANAAATVSWSAPANGGSPITSYTVTPFIGAAAQTPVPVTGNPPATSTTVSGLTNGTAYTFTVAATNAIGTGPASAASNSVTPVAPANQTITFGALSDATLLQSPVTVSASASSGLAVTFSSQTTSVCTTGGTNGKTVTLLTTGLCTIRADQAGNASFNAAPSVTQSFNVTKASQTITFSALGNVTLTQSPVTATATASSGLAVTFSSLTTSVCTVSGATITLVSAGPCTIQADQAGNATYNAAAGVQQSFTVSKAAQSITFPTPPDATLAQSPVTVAATASSSLAVTFSSLTTGVCTVSGTSVTLVTTGACTIQADQAGNATYNAAPAVSRSFNISQAAQSISFATPPDATLAQSPVGVSATASSGLAVSFSSVTTSVCTVSGTTVTLVSTGMCTIQADQAGNATYTAAAPVQRSFNVFPDRTGQTISFGTLPDATLAQSPLGISATATSGLTVTFSSLTTGVCTVSGANVTLLTAGTCTIQADQPGNAAYNPATSVTQGFTVTKASQSITFPDPADVTMLQSPVTVAATASSGLAVSFSSLSTGVCTVSGTSVTLVTTGTCTIQADQPGNATYTAAPSVQQSFTISKASQTITFNAIGNVTMLQSPVTATATASSGLAVTVTSLTTSVCTAGGTNGKTITLVAAGSCTLQADQAGNGSYNAATSVTQNFTVSKATQTITFNTLANVTMLQSPVTATATASSGLAVTVTSLTTSVCTAGGTNGKTITLVAAGSCTLQADQAGNGSYNAATSVTQNFTVSKATQSITFNTLANVAITQSPVTVAATASSNLAVTFTSLTTSVCTAGGTNGATITLVAAGTCTIQADQAGNATYNAASSVTQSFTISSTSCPCNLFGTSTPANLTANDPNAVELGMKFTSDIAGNVTGVRFYKSSTNTGTHVGNLWSSSGTLLATGTFTGETASGWQTLTFTTPVHINAGTTYVVSYHTNTGRYSYNTNGFATQVDKAPLHGLASGSSGNGVYAYGSSSSFPTNSFQATNYWVDVTFTP